MTDTLAAVARDEVLCSLLLPGFRPAVLPCLSRLRPDVASVLQAAEHAQAAMAAAHKVMAQVGGCGMSGSTQGQDTEVEA